MIDASKDKRIVNLFTRGSHHRNLSVIYIVQNLFYQEKDSRSISLNSHYLILFKNPRDKLQIVKLAKQMYPGQTNFFIKQYEEAVKRPFGYLLVDLKTTTPDNCRLRTNVLSSEERFSQAEMQGNISRTLTVSETAKSIDWSATSCNVRGTREYGWYSLSHWSQ